MSTELRDRLQAALGDSYLIERELGGGGMSRLFLANEASLNRKVVIKLLPPELASEVSALRFKQEIELAAHLQHPNILPVLNAGARDGLLYYVMPYVAGESLRHRLTNEGKLPVPDAIRVLHEIADALAQAHAEGVIHRDIKPENILLEGRHAVLTDFGVARALAEARTGGRLTETGLAVGTPGYMSPEQAAGERNIDARADVYALAVVGYEMLAGVPPFEGATAQAILTAHLTSTPKPLRAVRPETPRRVAEAIARALAKNPGERLRTAAELRDALAVETPSLLPSLARRLDVVAIAVLVVLAALGWWVMQRRKSAPLASELVAVAPFDVLDPDLGIWREGMVDVLARNLDGAGPLRTVPPTIVIRRWHGRADRASAAELGHATGAGLAIFGQLVATRGDSVKVTATLFDVAGGRALGEAEVRDHGMSMDRVADSLTFAILRELGRTRPVGAVRATTFRSTSLPALKAFLRGEQFFRRTAWDSALGAYRQAVEADSSFALAWRRMGTVTGWRVIGSDSLAGVYALRAGALNRGLPARDSLLITAESLATALYTNSLDTAWRAHQARLFATLQEVTRRFPEDPEGWYELGDARDHFRLIGRTPLEDALVACNRAIALDSAFGESYIHPVEWSLRLGRAEDARRYVAGLLSHQPTDKHASGLWLVDQVLQQPIARTAELERLIDTSEAEVLFEALVALSHWPDSQETALRLAHALAASRPSKTSLFNNAKFRTWWVSAALAYRGRLTEAYAVGGDSVTRVSEMAVLGGVSSDTAAALFRSWREDPPVEAAPDALPFGFNVDVFNALPWWAARRDSASIASFRGRMEAMAKSTTTPRDVVPWFSYGTIAGAAYLALAHGDSAEALRRFTSLPDTVCPCVYDQIIESQLLLAKARDQEALRVFRGHYPLFMSPAEGLWRLQRGRAYERLGQREQAVDDYRFVVSLWRRADAELQPYVSEAREALARLTNEPRP